MIHYNITSHIFLKFEILEFHFNDTGQKQLETTKRMVQYMSQHTHTSVSYICYTMCLQMGQDPLERNHLSMQLV